MLHSIRLWLLPLLFSALAPGLLAQDKTEPQIKQAVQDDKKPFDIWDNTNATERGDAMFAEVLKTAGGLETWDKIEALRFYLLKIRRVLVNQKSKERKVHHIVPRLCWFDRAGDGFTISEYTDGRTFMPMYRRDISMGNYAWAEANDQANRKPAQAKVSRTLVQRTAFLSLMPFSLHERGARWIFLKDLPGNNALYGVRLSAPLVMEEHDEIRDFAVVVDVEAKRIKQLQYSLVGEDRITMDKSSECYIDFVKPYEIAGVTLYSQHVWFYEQPHALEEFTIADVESLALPPAAVRRPWQAGGELWKSDLRADHWDPPVTPEGDSDDKPEEKPKDKLSDKPQQEG